MGGVFEWIQLKIFSNLFPDLNQTQQIDSKKNPKPTFLHLVYTYMTSVNNN